jgi:hypothetical protein
MNGSPSIAVAAGRWNRSAIEKTLIIVSIGALAGVMLTFFRQPFHLPGHKVIWWMPAIIATRLRTHLRGGATIGTISALCSAGLLGGRMPGGDLILPMAAVSGVLLDWVADRLDRKNASLPYRLIWLSFAGLIGNLMCMPLRLLSIGSHVAAGDAMSTIASFAIFGIIGGAIGCLLSMPHRATSIPPVS